MNEILRDKNNRIIQVNDLISIDKNPSTYKLKRNPDDLLYLCCGGELLSKYTSKRLEIIPKGSYHAQTQEVNTHEDLHSPTPHQAEKSARHFATRSVYREAQIRRLQCPNGKPIKGLDGITKLILRYKKEKQRLYTWVAVGIFVYTFAIIYLILPGL